MGWTQCVLDASMGYRGGLFVFCPIIGDINGNFQVVTGMNFASAVPPKRMKLVAIIHPDGQQAVDDFCQKYHAELEALKRNIL